MTTAQILAAFAVLADAHGRQPDHFTLEFQHTDGWFWSATAMRITRKRGRGTETVTPATYGTGATPEEAIADLGACLSRHG